jgi:hypothetical protein
MPSAGQQKPDGPGVLSGVKERRLKDGKKGGRWGPVRRIEDEPKRVLISRVQAESKEARYVVRRGDVSYALFDPEECLHVGRHDGSIGIVYRFKRLVWREYLTSGERGLLPWTGRRDRETLMWTAAKFALERAGQKPTAGAVWALTRPNAWGRITFWDDLTRRHKLALDLQVVRDVMES